MSCTRAQPVPRKRDRAHAGVAPHAREKAEYAKPLADRIRRIEERLRSNPLLAMESYPDECWMFDHAVALAAIRLSDALDGTDHSALFGTGLTSRGAS